MAAPSVDVKIDPGDLSVSDLRTEKALRDQFDNINSFHKSLNHE